MSVLPPISGAPSFWWTGSSGWGWEKSLLGHWYSPGVYSLPPWLFFSVYWLTALPTTQLFNSWSLSQSLDSCRMARSLHFGGRFQRLVLWCRHNKLELNTLRAVEMSGFLETPLSTAPITVANSPVSTVESFKLLGTIMNVASSILRKVQQRTRFLPEELRKGGPPLEPSSAQWTARGSWKNDCRLRSHPSGLVVPKNQEARREHH